ncbi:type II toxin-antitoxin system VapC family toxin [Nitriliruptor alkaliphilus]|uniref:type II toxin-antitoxin system VapC family toxin n=1 Tax=Nitriliruptor alkaliphilus TaxID=427918 RepID=UPI000698D080|nr:type II toxin-antitoxin system VapC family toxin [Nitriliruptor alkaliphilus]
MLVVDAGALFEVIAGATTADVIRDRLAEDEEQFAPHLIDVEVLGVIRKHREVGLLDATAARQAVEDLRDWPGERVGHRPFLERAWELRASIRGQDAMYVALAEALGATLLTTDARLARANGPRCPIEVHPAP